MGRAKRWAPLAASLAMLLGLGAFGVSSVRTSREGAEVAYRDMTMRKQATVAALADQYLQLAAKEAFDVAAAHDLAFEPGDAGDQAMLEELLTKQGGFFNHGAVLTSLDGDPLSVFVPGGGLPSPSDPGYDPLRASLRRGEPGISSLMRVGTVPLVAVGVPVLDGGVPEGILVAFFRADTSHLQRYSAQLGRSSAATGMVVDSDGNVVAARDVALVGTDIDGSPALSAPDEMGTADFTRDDREMFVAWAPIATGGWILVEEQPASEFYAAVRGQSQTAQVALLGVLVFGAIAITILNHRTDRARRRGERRCEALVQDASDVITVLDREGRITYVSPAIERVLRHSADDRVGTHALDLIHPGDVTKVRAAVTAVRSAPAGRQRLRARALRADGTTCTAELVISNLVDTRGVEGVVVSLRDITELAELHDELAHHASHDALTSLPNRRRIKDSMSRALAAEDARDTVAALFLDLDGFKAVNDRLGHDAGDALLVQVAERLRECVRDEDEVARIGGDEFVILVHEDPEGAAEHIAQRVVGSLSRPFTIGPHEAVIGVSVGIAIGGAAERPDELLRRADRAMYEAKQAGRGRYAFAEDATAESATVT